MKQLDLFWDTIAPLIEKSPPNEQKKITDAYRRVTNRARQLETNYNLAIQGRAAVHTLLKKTSEDLIQRYQVLFEYSGTALMVVEPDGTISLVNSFFEHVFNCSREDIENKRNYIDFVEESYKNKLSDYHQRRLKGDTSIPSHYEAKVVTGKGRILDVVLTVGLFPGVNQSIISILDITERKQIERELKRGEERYRILLQNINDGVIVHDISEKGPGQIFEVNDRICQILGYTREELLRLSIQDLDVPEHQDKVPVIAEHIFSKNHAVFETEYLKKDGDRIVVEISARLFDLQGKTTILAIVRDITEKKILEHEMEYYTAELMQHARDLQLVNDKLTLLNRITRHDINNQLMVILGIIDIMQDEFSDPSLQEYIGTELQAARNIEEQITFTKEYQDIGVQSPGWFDLRNLILSAKENLPLSRITVTVNINGIEIFADPLVKKVFYTLLENAIRHGERVTDIGFSCQEEKESLIILYEDNGVGVPEVYKTDIFLQKHFKHTGFGLFLSVSILKITGITIQETGIPGVGSRFELTVPRGAYRFTTQS